MNIQDSRSDLTFGVPHTPSREVAARTTRAAADRTTLPDLYVALLTGKVYLIGAEAVLEDDGPAFELPIEEGPRLRVFTARTRLPADTVDAEVLSILFAQVVATLPHDVDVVVDAGTGAELTIPCRHVAILRDLLGAP